MYEFRKDITTTVPTSCLIEDYQALQKAVKNNDWSEVETVMDCLATVIDNDTYLPADLEGKIKPSPSSVIVPGWQDGILLERGGDFLCAHQLKVSRAMEGGVCQCSEKCPHYHLGCFPEDGLVMVDINGQSLVMARTTDSDEAIIAAIGVEDNW